MKRFFIAMLVLAALIAPVFRTDNADAHVLERDGNISAVLHMPPNDEPVAGKQTTINLAFAASDTGFDINGYEVTVKVKRARQEISSTPMRSLDGSRTSATATVVFPEAGAYQVVAEGRPKAAGQRFLLPYGVRAEQPAGQAQAPTAPSSRIGFDFWAICLGSWTVLAVVAAGRIRSGGRYRSR